MRRSASILVAMLLAAGATALPALPASAAPVLSFSAASELPYLADGAAVAVPVTYVCPPKYGGSRGFADFTAEVQETLSGGGVVDGFDTGGPSVVLACDGGQHATEVIVTPAAALAYRDRRPARLTLSVLACNADETQCVQPVVTATERVKPAAADDPANQPLNATGRLLANGDVRITLPHGCPAGTLPRTEITFSQRTAHGTAATGIGSADQAMDCTLHTTTVTFTPEVGQAVRGIAYLVGDRATCHPFTCSPTTVFKGAIRLT